MKPAVMPWRIIGQGLAGTCVAWQLLKRGSNCTVTTDGRDGSSRVAAGLVNPVTGKNFAPSWRIGEFLPEAEKFYQELERLLGIRFWHPLPLIRLARDANEWHRIEARLTLPQTSPWIIARVEPPTGWHAAVELRGGARLDCQCFLDASLAHFERLGMIERRCFDSDTDQDPALDATRLIRCEGASGLLANSLGPHRCAKGEILTIEAPTWPQSHIRIGAGGWLVPIGGNRFKAGATYEWELLDPNPTAAGRAHVLEIARALGGDDAFSVIDHLAGVRPILRRSQPLIGNHPHGGWFLNGLGSKGSLYAPGCARRLVEACLHGKPIEVDLDFVLFANNRSRN